jgi:hypothetical protein
VFEVKDNAKIAEFSVHLILNLGVAIQK